MVHLINQCMISDLTILYYVRMYAVTSWEVYAAHVRQCETYACSQCDILGRNFNTDYVAEEREHERIVAVSNYKNHYKSDVIGCFIGCFFVGWQRCHQDNFIN